MPPADAAAAAAAMTPLALDAALDPTPCRADAAVQGRSVDAVPAAPPVARLGRSAPAERTAESERRVATAARGSALQSPSCALNVRVYPPSTSSRCHRRLWEGFTGVIRARGGMGSSGGGGTADDDPGDSPADPPSDSTSRTSLPPSLARTMSLASGSVHHAFHDSTM